MIPPSVLRATIFNFRRRSRPQSAMSKYSTRAQKLKDVVSLLSSAADTVIEQWALEDDQNDQDKATVGGDRGPALSSKELYDARRIILAATGTLTELVDEPQTLLMKISTLFYESRALHITAEHRIPDILDKATNQQDGVHVDDIGKEIGLDSVKLGPLLSTYIYDCLIY